MKTRIIAAVALLPLLLLVVLVAPKIFTAILFGLMAAIGAYELLKGTGIVTHPRLIAYSMVMALLVALWSHFAWGAVWAQIGILVLFIALFAEIMISGMKLAFEKVQGNHEVISRAGSSLKGRFRRSSTIIELELNLCCKFMYILTCINLRGDLSKWRILKITICYNDTPYGLV